MQNKGEICKNNYEIRNDSSPNQCSCRLRSNKDKGFKKYLRISKMSPNLLFN